MSTSGGASGPPGPGPPGSAPHGAVVHPAGVPGSGMAPGVAGSFGGQPIRATPPGARPTAPIQHPAASRVAPDARLTTEHIQKMLDDNQQLILSILECQDCGRMSESAQLQTRLQQNLVLLAGVADQQPARTVQGTAATASHVPGTGQRPSYAPPQAAGKAPEPARRPPARKWDDEEEQKFQECLEKFVVDGKAQLKEMAGYIGTRTVAQVRTHYQRWQKLQKAARDKQALRQPGSSHASQAASTLQNHSGSLESGMGPPPPNKQVGIARPNQSLTPAQVDRPGGGTFQPNASSSPVPVSGVHQSRPSLVPSGATHPMVQQFSQQAIRMGSQGATVKPQPHGRGGPLMPATYQATQPASGGMLLPNKPTVVGQGMGASGTLTNSANAYNSSMVAAAPRILPVSYPANLTPGTLSGVAYPVTARSPSPSYRSSPASVPARSPSPSFAASPSQDRARMSPQPNGAEPSEGDGEPNERLPNGADPQN